jgi:lipid-A-disaccharide synthase
MKYYIISGERSGDLHASNLIKAIKSEDRQADVRGIGGEYLQSAGANIFRHYRDIAIMGFWEVFTSLSKIKKIFNDCQSDILSYKPDVVILVDFGGFNLRMAKYLKENGIKVYYYISPKIWAWNQSRANKVKAYVDKMFVILPFEKDFYKRFNYEVDYVGNPVYDAIAAHTIDPSFKVENNLSDKPIIAILPGSRQQEVQLMLSTMASIIADFSDYRFVIAAVSNLPKAFYLPYEMKGISVVYDKTYDLLLHSQAAVVASGTATLETGLLDIPQVVCYKTSAITYAIGKQLVKVDFISLVNLIAGKQVVRELLQKDFTAEKIKEELNNILYKKFYRDQMLQGYKEVKSILGAPGASEKTAKLMVKYLTNTK